MTFIDANLRLFLDGNCIKPLRRRPEGKLKAYRSSEDLRAWNFKAEDRRQQILEVVRRDTEKCQGGLLPAILKLFSKKNIHELKKCIRLLWSFLNECQLTPEDQTNLRRLEARLGQFCMQVIDGCTCAGDVGLVCHCIGKRKPLGCSCTQRTCVCHTDKKDPTTGSYKIQTTGPVRLTTKVRGIKPGMEMPSSHIAVKAQPRTSESNNGNKLVTVIKNVYPQKAATLGTIDNKTYTNTSTVSTRTEGGQPVDKKSGPGFCTKKNCSANIEHMMKVRAEQENMKQTQKIRSTHVTYPVFEHTTSTPLENIFKKMELSLSTFGSDNDESIKKLQDALLDRESVCEQQQNNIESLQSERDKLNNRIQECLQELEKLKQLNNMTTSENPSPTNNIDADGERIKEELESLKKYSLQLRETEEENQKLKKERDLLKQKLEMPSVSILPFSGDSLQEEEMIKLRKERDSLADKVRELEKELEDSQQDEVYKDSSAMLDKVLAERDAMFRDHEQVNEMKSEIESLRKKAQRMDELEKKLREVQNRTASDYELRRAKSQCDCLEKEMENVKAERDSFRRRIEFLTNDLENLKDKAKEAAILRVERDKLQIKINSLNHIQIHNDNLRLKCKTLENTINEGFIYKQKYEELLAMESQCQVWKSQAEASEQVKRERDCLRRQVKDLQSCISEQETEIKELMERIQSMTKHKDETQVRMREAISSMRDELEKKDNLIAASEAKLDQIQTDLKSSIQGVSCETVCYKVRIEELEAELDTSKNQITALEQLLRENHIDTKNINQSSGSDYNSLAAMKRELEAAKMENKKLQEIAKKMVVITGDEHVQQMLKHSECAIRKVVTELSKQYKEWDHYKKERRRSRSRSYDRSSFIEREPTVVGDHVVQASHETSNNERVNLCPGELIALKLRNAQLLEKLQSNYYKMEEKT